MIKPARQRADVPKTRSSSAWLPVAVLAALAASAQAQQQATVNPVPAQEAPAAPAVQSRGVSAQAATDAAAAQDPASLEVPTPPVQVAPVKDDSGSAQATEAVATEVAQSAPTPISTSIPAATSTATTAPVQAGAVRGVMFRITPPVTVSLPAETLPTPQPMDADGAAAQLTAPPPMTPAPATPAAPARPSYLLATIHFGTPEEQGLDYAVLERALAEVDTFVNEADLDSPWQPAFDDYRWLPPEQPLSKMISKDSFAMARSLLPNVRAQDLQRMKPWSVLALLEARGETGGEATMDARLQRAAAAAGKRLVHLESLEQQLQALDCVPASEHSLVLDERLRAPWILRDESAAAMAHFRNRNLEAWLADIDRMHGLGYQGKAIEQRARLCLLEARNARWIGQLQTLFQDGPCLVAVGAVHLVGVDGLIAALRRDGYLVVAEPL